MNRKHWPSLRLRVRAIVSTTMVLGWVLSALSGLLPYFFAEKGPASRSNTVLGITKSVWLSVHVWLSIGMVVFTVIHVLLNRKGVARAVKVVSGADLNKRANPTTAAVTTRPRPKRGYAWVAVVISVLALTVGGILTAGRGTGSSADDHGPGWGRNHQSTEYDAGDLLLEEPAFTAEAATLGDLFLER
jgi:Mg2+/citrate symporter